MEFKIDLGEIDKEYEIALEFLAKSEGDEFGNSAKKKREAEDVVGKYLMIESLKQKMIDLVEEDKSSFDFEDYIYDEISRAVKKKRKQLKETGIIKD